MIKLFEEEQIIPDNDFFAYQDSHMERIHKHLFNLNDINYYWLEKVENAGDIGRELAVHKDGWSDIDYIFEKVRKLQKVVKYGSDEWRWFKQPSKDKNTEEKMIKEYRIVYHRYNGNLGILGQLSKTLSFATLDRDISRMDDYLGQFEKLYKKYHKG